MYPVHVILEMLYIIDRDAFNLTHRMWTGYWDGYIQDLKMLYNVPSQCVLLRKDPGAVL